MLRSTSPGARFLCAGVLTLAAASAACGQDATPPREKAEDPPRAAPAPQEPPRREPPKQEEPAKEPPKEPPPADPPPKDPPDPAAPKPEPPKPDADATSAAELPARIAELYDRAGRRPPPLDPNAADPAKQRAESAKARTAWEAAVTALAAAGDRYVSLVSDPDPLTLYRAGFGKSALAGRQSQRDALATRAVAATMLSKALAASKPDDEFRADAEKELGHIQLFLAAAGKATWEEASAHLREATLRLRKAGRIDDSGRCAYLGLESLLRNGKDEAAREFAASVGAAAADFGVSTPSIRGLALRTATTVGSKLPDLPDGVDTEGRALKWAELRGRPLLLHFFQANRPTGHLSQERDVATTLRPLHEELSGKGLRLVGISMDLALTKDQVERIRANWFEWGVKERVQDGSLDSVRAWAADEGMTWPWLWDGKWGENPWSKALGGPGRSVQHAVLVDSAGVIRWRGDAPFLGLPEAARKACP